MLPFRLLTSHTSRSLFSTASRSAVQTTIRRTPPRNVTHIVGRLLIGCSGVGVWTSAQFLRKLHCDAAPIDPWLLVPQKREHESVSKLNQIVTSPWRLLVEIWRIIRKTLRCLSLFLRFSPIAIVYPISKLSTFTEDLWWKCFIFIIQSSGPTFLKLGQWASTRRDIFSKQFCDRLSVLHTKTKNSRMFRDCEEVIDTLFGRGFYRKHKRTVFTHIDPYSIGSGCIAQVYRLTVDVAELEKATGQKYPELKGRKLQELAIKVADHNVEKKIELDLSIIRSIACMSQRLMPSLRYVDPMGAIEQFEMVLRRQVDLRNEAKALIKFAANFEHSKSGIRFPIVIAYSKNILAETFEEGIYINHLVAEEDNSQLKSRQSVAVRRRIAQLGARALLKMIFVDNFVHGDLHPGNILIRFNDQVDTLPGVHLAPPAHNIFRRMIDFIRNRTGWRAAPCIRFTDSPFMQDEPTLVLLDTGIAVSETKEKLDNLKSLFRAIVERKGYDAGHMLLTRSPKQNCQDPDRFCRQVEALVDRALSERSLRKLNISGLLSEMFSIVAENHVSLDSSFTTVILSVMVLEGFGRSLDPDLDLFQCARPYLLNVLF